eukprot:3129902-Amphidinium_carterae.1
MLRPPRVQHCEPRAGLLVLLLLLQHDAVLLASHALEPYSARLLHRCKTACALTCVRRQCGEGRLALLHIESSSNT